MYKKQVVKIFSIVAIVLSSVGLIFSILGTVLLPKSSYSLTFFLGVVSWAFLLWASIIGYRLCVSYNLYEDEYKKIAIRIYLIIIAFVLFFFVGIILGLALSVGLLSALWSLKRNYDEWEYNNTPFIPKDIELNETSNDSN